MSLTYIICGFLVGTLVGLTGVGGGALMTPLLTMVFGVPASVAIGTDLAFASITKVAGTIAHKSIGTVNWRVVRLLCFGALPAALVAILCLKTFGVLNQTTNQILRYTIGCSVLLTVISLIFKSQMQSWINAHPEKQLHGRTLTVATIFVGAILGSLVTVTSIGAGAVGATLILLLYPHFSAAEVAGTDIAYAVPLTAIAAIGHWWLGSTNWLLLSTLLVGSVPGIVLGSLLTRAIPDKVLRFILASSLTMVAVKLFL